MSQYQTDYGNAWTRDSLYPNDAFVDESAAHFTILRPKSSLNPYLTTSPSVYKDYRNSIYSLAANVNSLEATDSKKPWLQNLLHKEISYPSSPSTVTQVVMSHAPTIFESHSTQSVDNLHQSHPLHQQQQQPLLSSSSSSPFTLATTASQITFPIPTTTPTITLTTDELFSHYKQPVVETRPVPMFLIIQGHSKVKTYGGKDSVGNSETTKHLPKIRPVTMNKDPVINHVVSSDFHPSESHIVVNATTTHKPKPLKSIKVQSNSNTNSTMDSLLSFLDSSLGIFMAPDEIKSTKMPSKKVKATTAERTKSMKSTETEATPSSTTSVAYSVINSTVATTTTASNWFPCKIIRNKNADFRLKFPFVFIKSFCSVYLYIFYLFHLHLCWQINCFYSFRVFRK